MAVYYQDPSGRGGWMVEDNETPETAWAHPANPFFGIPPGEQPWITPYTGGGANAPFNPVNTPIYDWSNPDPFAPPPEVGDTIALDVPGPILQQRGIQAAEEWTLDLSGQGEPSSVLVTSRDPGPIETLPWPDDTIYDEAMAAPDYTWLWAVGIAALIWMGTSEKPRHRRRR